MLFIIITNGDVSLRSQYALLKVTYCKIAVTVLSWSQTVVGARYSCFLDSSLVKIAWLQFPAILLGREKKYKKLADVLLIRTVHG